MKKNKKREKRNKLVIKSNKLIRDVRYELSEKEQKLIIYLISLIAKGDENFNELHIMAKDYFDICGINSSGKNYEDIKKTIKNLADKSWWIEIDNDTETLFKWIDTAKVDKNNGKIEIKLSSSLEPFLLNLTENFTKYELINILTLSGKYSLRLYELFKSYLWQGEWEINISDLKKIINCNGYPAYKEFNRSVLSKAVKEINKYTDLKVSYVAIKKGKSTSGIKFSIKEKDNYIDNMNLLINRSKKIGQ